MRPALPVTNRYGRRTGRRGRAFTLVELLVSMGITAALVSLLVPAVLHVRETSRRIVCSNHLRQIGTAMQSHGGQYGRLPAAGYMGLNASSQVEPFFGWAVQLLPQIEESNRYDRWDFDAPLSSPTNTDIADASLPVFTCPSDPTLGGTRDLSYVVNGGFGWTVQLGSAGDCPIGFPSLNPIDLNGNGVRCPVVATADGDPSDRNLLTKTGLFFLESWQVPGTVRHHRFATITDGLSHTILATENIRTGYDPLDPQASWATADPLRVSFYITSDICHGGSCAAAGFSAGTANADHGINTGLDLPEGEAPWPNSMHPHGVNVCMAEGSVRFLAEQVASQVYYSLVTPQGALLPAPLTDSEFSPGSF